MRSGLRNACNRLMTEVANITNIERDLEQLMQKKKKNANVHTTNTYLAYIKKLEKEKKI